MYWYVMIRDEHEDETAWVGVNDTRAGAVAATILTHEAAYPTNHPSYVEVVLCVYSASPIQVASRV